MIGWQTWLIVTEGDGRFTLFHRKDKLGKPPRYKSIATQVYPTPEKSACRPPNGSLAGSTNSKDSPSDRGPKPVFLRVVS